MMLPSVLAVGIFAIVPLIGMFALSLTDFHLIKKWDQEFGFHNFIKLYNNKRFMASVNVMLLLSVFGVFFQVILGPHAGKNLKNGYLKRFCTNGRTCKGQGGIQTYGPQECAFS